MNFLIEKILLEIKPPTRHGDMGMLLLILKSSDPILASQEVVKRHISLSNTTSKGSLLKNSAFHNREQSLEFVFSWRYGKYFFSSLQLHFEVCQSS